METYSYTCKAKKIAETLERCMIALQNDSVISIRGQHGLKLIYSHNEYTAGSNNAAHILHNAMGGAFSDDVWFISYMPMNEAYDELPEDMCPVLADGTISNGECKAVSEQLKEYLFSLVGDEYRSQSDNEKLHPVLTQNGTVCIGAADDKALLEYAFRLEEYVRMSASVLLKRRKIIDQAGDRLISVLRRHEIVHNGGCYLNSDES